PDDRAGRRLVPSEDGATWGPSRAEGEDRLFRAVDRVVRREDVPLVIQDDAGSEAAPRPGTPGWTVGPLRRAHVHGTGPRSLDRLNVCVLQIGQHGPPMPRAAYVERVPWGAVTRGVPAGTRNGRGPRARCKTAGAGRT